MSYVPPQLRVFQSFTGSPSLNNDIRRPLIIGPAAMLHRFDVSTEKPDITVGLYNSENATTVSYPDRAAGSKIDLQSVKVFVERAPLRYFQDTTADTTGGYGTVAPVVGRPNQVRHSTVNFVTSGVYGRSGLLHNRDVQVGDMVLVRGVEDPEGACIEHKLWTSVTGFVADTLASALGATTADVTNPNSTNAAAAVTFTAGQANCIQASVSGTYDALGSGVVSETYTVTVVKSAISGCNATRLRVTSASGTDNVAEVTPAAFGQPTAIGTRGLSLTFALLTGACQEDATSGSYAANTFIIGQTWTVTGTGAYVKACATTTGTYTGLQDDTYIVEVTKGGLFNTNPQISITTARGADIAGPITVTAVNTPVAIGAYGLSIAFAKCGTLGDEITGLRKGDKFYVGVTAAAPGPVRTLVLRHNLTAPMRALSNLDLALFMPRTIELPQVTRGVGGTANYTFNGTELNLNPGATAPDTSWIVGGQNAPLPLASGGVDASGIEFGRVYVQYREWLFTTNPTLQFVTAPSGLEDIPGPTDPDNPLKWGASKALTAAGGAGIGYVQVKDPDDIADWQVSLSVIENRGEVYNLVPMSNDIDVLNACVAASEVQSAPEVSNWKGVILSAPIVEIARIQPNTLLQAVTADNPQASGTQYTLMTVTGGTLLTSGVRPGDSVRYLYTADGFGGELYTTFTVAEVLSETTLVLETGTSVAITVPQRVEIYHVNTKVEMADSAVAFAQQFSNRRVVVTVPDVVYEGGRPTAGYYASASIGGLIAAVLPHQGLTNVSIPGIGSVSERTRDLFSNTQLERMSAGGVWVITADRVGNTFTKHAVTTDMSDLKNREEMIRRNADSTAYDFAAILRKYVGQTNATPTVLALIEYEFDRLINDLTTTVLVPGLGPRLLAASIGLDENGQKLLRVHPLAADRIQAMVSATYPAPANNIDLYITG